jgi:hypothetical protein
LKTGLPIIPFLCRNRRILFSLLIITPVGFYGKFYSGPWHYWVNNSLSGVLYEIFWCLVLVLCFKRLKPTHIAGIVLAVTCSVEFLQLWRPPFLALLRRNFFGVTILGNVFTWSDFPYYFLVL